MTPLERLANEQLPTGTFGHAQKPRPTPRPARPWTAEEQDTHWDDLRQAVGAPREQRPTRLRLITDPANRPQEATERRLTAEQPDKATQDHQGTGKPSESRTVA